VPYEIATRLICIPFWRMHRFHPFAGAASRVLKKFTTCASGGEIGSVCVSAPPEVCARRSFLDNKPHVTGAQGNFNGPKQNKFSAATRLLLLIYYLSLVERERAESSRARLKREQDEKMKFQQLSFARERER
jgi:hypothetical protein